MNTFTKQQLLFILDLIRKEYGAGYAEGEVGKLQAKLSILLALAEDGPALPQVSR